MSSPLGRWWQKFKDTCRYLSASLAIVLVKRKLKRRPQDWSLWLTVGRLYAIGYQWPQAFEALERARQISPKNEVINQHLARVREAAKQDSRNRSTSEK